MLDKTSILSFIEDFASTEACLQYLFDNLYPNKTKLCKCKTEAKYKKVPQRLCYQCSKCRKQIYPMKGTIFQGSTVDLRKWFLMIYHLHTGSVSTRKLMVFCGILSYPTALRMRRKIQKEMYVGKQKLERKVEIDESFFGGKKHLDKLKKKDAKRRKSGKRCKYDGKGIGHKFIVFGMLQRKGVLVLRHIKRKTKKVMLPIISKHIDLAATVYSDKYTVYEELAGMGYRHYVIEDKKSNSFGKGRYTNGVEGAWSLIKREIKGSHIQLSKKYLQCYLNEFAYRYNKRNNPDSSYHDLLQIVLS